MFIELPNHWIVILNALGIPVVHLALAWLSLRLPASCFSPSSPLYRIREWEREGERYQTCFRVRSWKKHLPDGAGWLSGFTKRTLQSREKTYLHEFRLETCRGEWSHWLQMAVLFLFVAWTPFPASLIIIAYALLSNLPCLIAQRHLRGRLNRLLKNGPTRC
ncbi:hypothetical protein [Roseibacillus ishigakijimensis]|uniref:Glycosyl-4,4'-diaponeurosporenoate acyltransferase n=1 Tax=Roseibacillus ishigakijimensis TaxID=454146 RepID=A0A934RRF8_9BACT|nr:hypothetical protein [Roseibacillus ishigakijimensis]MBK1835553.1 hypothetical protein [Roseibacillus ishigakijimensis]